MPSLPEGVGVLGVVVGALVRDRAKGNGVRRADRQLVARLLRVGECLADGPSAVAAIVMRKVSRSGSERGAFVGLRLGFRCFCGPGSSWRVALRPLSDAWLWCFVCDPSDPS